MKEVQKPGQIEGGISEEGERRFSESVGCDCAWCTLIQGLYWMSISYEKRNDCIGFDLKLQESVNVWEDYVNVLFDGYFRRVTTRKSPTEDVNKTF